VFNEGESGNQPIMDPNLIGDIPHRPSEPNAIVFTSDGNPVPGVIGATKQWDVPYDIVIMANDDDELQAEDAEADGDENYQAYIEFWVEATSDERYTVWDEEDEEYYGLERSIEVRIEDNESGAFGRLTLDIGNPNAATDPNYLDDDGNPMPDCYVDIYDAIEMASRWFNCTEPLDPGCWE
jgi:hypothetical protein